MFLPQILLTWFFHCLWAFFMYQLFYIIVDFSSFVKHDELIWWKSYLLVCFSTMHCSCFVWCIGVLIELVDHCVFMFMFLVETSLLVSDTSSYWLTFNPNILFTIFHERLSFDTSILNRRKVSLPFKFNKIFYVVNLFIDSWHCKVSLPCNFTRTLLHLGDGFLIIPLAVCPSWKNFATC